jgi:hypothetical protein
MGFQFLRVEITLERVKIISMRVEIIQERM